MEFASQIRKRSRFKARFINCQGKFPCLGVSTHTDHLEMMLYATMIKLRPQ